MLKDLHLRKNLMVCLSCCFVIYRDIFKQIHTAVLEMDFEFSLFLQQDESVLVKQQTPVRLLLWRKS